MLELRAQISGVAVTAESSAPWRCEERTEKNGKRDATKDGRRGGNLISSNNRKKREIKGTGLPRSGGLLTLATILSRLTRSAATLLFALVLENNIREKCPRDVSTREMNLPSKGPGSFETLPAKERKEKRIYRRLSSRLAFHVAISRMGVTRALLIRD